MKSSILPAVLITLLALFVFSGCAGPDEKSEDEIKNAEWHYKMGTGYFQASEIPLAIRELSAAVKMDPKHADAQHLLGFIYMGRREYDKSLDRYNAAIAAKPDFFIAMNNRGSLYLAMNRWEDAIADFEVLIEEPLYPTPELAYNNLGWAHFNLHHLSKAREYLKMAIFLKPTMCLAQNNLGLVYQASHQRVEAAEAFQTAINKCPNNYAEPHFNLGKMMQEDGHKGALEHFRACAEMEPETNLGRRCRQYLQIRR